MGTSTFHVFPCHCLYASFLLLWLIISSKHGYAFEGRKLGESHLLSDEYYTVELSSLRPSTACERHTKVDDDATSLEVVHRYGPCSQLYEDQVKLPSLAEIFREDQLRVDWIQLRLSEGIGNDVWKKTNAITVPAMFGLPFKTLNYIVTVQLGTPSKQLSLAFDTGSSLTWTQCQPCTGTCYNQTGQIFDPSKSTSYGNISCYSPACRSLSSQYIAEGCDYSSSTCVYHASYADESKTTGYLSKEKLILGSNDDVINNFTFGCGQENKGLFGTTDGLLGLSRGSLSFIAQTASKYNEVFSYCLPSSSSSTGFLTFGGSPSKSANFTPFSKLSSFFYGIDIVGIRVGGRPLPIPSSVFSTTGAIIDSGTVITRLQPEAYSALRTAFRGRMTKYNISQSPDPTFDTCYDFSGLNSVKVPKITFSFSGPVNLVIPVTGTLIQVYRNIFCLAFAGNKNPHDSATFGNAQQRTYEVIHDVRNGKLGFVPGRCS